MDSSRWQIDTPEQVHMSFELAGIGSRFVALALDMLFQSVAFTLLMVILAALSVTMVNLGSWAIAGVIVAAALIFFVYFILFEGLTHGKTPGKMICGLRVIRDDGRPLDWNGTLARNLIRLIDFLPAFYAVGVISMFISKESRRVGDMVAGTLVAREPRVKRAKSFASPARTSGDPTEPVRGMAVPEPPPARVCRYPLRESEMALVRELMTRGRTLDRVAYAALCRQVAWPLYEKFMIPMEQRGDNAAFLQMLWEENK